MSANLLLWKWSLDFDTPDKRQRHKLKFSDIADAFCKREDHPSIGKADIPALITKIEVRFGTRSEQRHFILHPYERALLVEFANIDRIDIISKIAPLARSLGFNSTEI